MRVPTEVILRDPDSGEQLSTTINVPLSEALAGGLDVQGNLKASKSTQ